MLLVRSESCMGEGGVGVAERASGRVGGWADAWGLGEML